MIDKQIALQISKIAAEYYFAGMPAIQAIEKARERVDTNAVQNP